MKIKRSKTVLSPRPLSAITSIGSPEPNITETNKDSTSPEIIPTIVSSQANDTQLPSISRCNRTSEVQPIIHQSFCSKLNTNQVIIKKKTKE